uniref:RDD domain-containing protein n=1 Tax=candidate division WOR-3 bacterium TaxID=2052148 RepID=A0A7V4E6L5_UNCW3
MDFENWFKEIESNDKKLKLYNLHKKYFWISRIAILTDMFIVIAIAITLGRFLGIFSNQPYAVKTFISLIVLMIITYFAIISIPLFLFSRTAGLTITGLKAVSSKTLSGPSLLETYYYIGQDKRYQKNYPIYLFLIPANLKI